MSSKLMCVKTEPNIKFRVVHSFSGWIFSGAVNIL